MCSLQLTKNFLIEDNLPLKAEAVYEQPTPPEVKLFTSTITTTHNSTVLEKTVELWSKKIIKKVQLAISLPHLSKELRQIVFDSKNAISYLKNAIPLDLDENEKLYVAYDSAKSIQGVALIQLKSDTMQLTYLCTNPDTLQIAERSTTIRGTGTALIRHITNEALQHKIEQISLKALPSAVGFYKKFGFEETSTGHDMHTPTATIHSLLEDKYHPSVIAESEPILALVA